MGHSYKFLHNNKEVQAASPTLEIFNNIIHTIIILLVYVSSPLRTLVCDDLSIHTCPTMLWTLLV